MGSSVFCAFHSHSNICCPLLPSTNTACRPHGRGQICSASSLCSPNHNGTAPYIPAQGAKANDFNARWASDAIFLSHPDGACGCKCRVTPMLYPCLLKRVSLLVYLRVCTQRNFQFGYHSVVILTRSLCLSLYIAHRGFLLAACYIHSCSQTTASGWNKAISFDATPIFPRRPPMGHNKRSPTTAFVVIPSRPRLYHCR
jgi:hypothetical protein